MELAEDRNDIELSGKMLVLKTLLREWKQEEDNKVFDLKLDYSIILILL
jgi:hypothetical protein